MRLIFRRTLIFLFSLVALSGCQSLDYHGSPSYVLYLQDSPADFERFTMSVVSAEIYDGQQWIDLKCPNRSNFDLLGLTGGEMLKIGDSFLAEGHYSQLRIVFSDEMTLRYLGDLYSVTPSSVELVLPLDLTMQEDVQQVDIVDLDAAQSLTSSPGGVDGSDLAFSFSPVGSLVDLSMMGVLNFSVVNTSDKALGETVYCWAQNNSTGAIYSTYLNQKSLLGVLKLPLGNYTLHIETPTNSSYKGTIIEDVQVEAGVPNNLGVVHLEALEQE